MCVIVHLVNGYTLPFDLLQTAAWNNPHGYGIIVKSGGKKLKVIKKFSPDGNDAGEIHKILKDNEEHERFLHLRWRTEGEVNEENTQPFTVFKNSKRHIEFAHNGTIVEMTPFTQQGYGTNYKPPSRFTIDELPDHLKKASDTERYAELRLGPLFQSITGPEGTGDYTNPIIREVIDKLWPGGTNKGLIVSNDLPTIFLGHWETIKDEEKSFMASNNSYFHRLVRGPVWEVREEERKKREEAERSTQKQKVAEKMAEGATEVVQVYSEIFSKRFQLSEEALRRVTEDADIFSPAGQRALCTLTGPEIDLLVKSLLEGKNGNQDVSFFIYYLLEFLHKSFEENDHLKSQVMTLNGIDPDEDAV